MNLFNAKYIARLSQQHLDGLSIFFNYDLSFVLLNRPSKLSIDSSNLRYSLFEIQAAYGECSEVYIEAIVAAKHLMGTNSNILESYCSSKLINDFQGDDVILYEFLFISGAQKIDSILCLPERSKMILAMISNENAEPHLIEYAESLIPSTLAEVDSDDLISIAYLSKYTNGDSLKLLKGDTFKHFNSMLQSNGICCLSKLKLLPELLQCFGELRKLEDLADIFFGNLTDEEFIGFLCDSDSENQIKFVLLFAYTSMKKTIVEKMNFLVDKQLVVKWQSLHLWISNGYNSYQNGVSTKSLTSLFRTLGYSDLETKESAVQNIDRFRALFIYYLNYNSVCKSLL